VFLRGNHETYIDDFLNGEVALAHWQSLGGYETLMSYGIDADRMLRDGEDEQAVREAFARTLPDRHREFLANLSNQHFIGRYQFVHAGVRPGVAPEDQAQHDLLWIRDAFLLHDGDFGYCVVHGHTPARMPEFRPNRINIDTGAFATGVLTCIRIDQTGVHLLEGYRG
jgi:serine/threonine protein phosphatase 1